MTKSRFIFARVAGLDHRAYLVYRRLSSRKRGDAVGEVWSTWDPYSLTTKHGWCAYGKGGHVYQTRLEAAQSLTRFGT